MVQTLKKLRVLNNKCQCSEQFSSVWAIAQVENIYWKLKFFFTFFYLLLYPIIFMSSLEAIIFIILYFFVSFYPFSGVGFSRLTYLIIIKKKFFDWNYPS